MYSFYNFTVQNGQRVGEPPAALTPEEHDFCERALFRFEMQDTIYSRQDHDDMARFKILLALPVVESAS